MQISLQIKKPCARWFDFDMSFVYTPIWSPLHSRIQKESLLVEKEVYIKFIMMLSRYQLHWIYVLLFPESLIKMNYQM